MTTSALWRALVLTTILVLGSAVGASAAGPGPNPTPTIQPSLNLPLTGSFEVVPGSSGSQSSTVVLRGQTQGDLALSFTSQLTPAQYAGGSRRGPQAVLLKGTVTVQDPSGTTSWFQGDAQATLNNDGTGVLGIVASGTGPYQGATLTLEANYVVDSSGAMSGQFTGGMEGALAASGPSQSPAQPIDHTYWFLSRAAGIVAYLLLCAAVLFGLAVRTKAGDVILGRWRVYDLHQTAALAAVAFLLLHVFSLLGDRYFGFSVSQLLLPFAAPYRIVWVAVGILSFYLIVILAASFYVRRWITYRTWRALHYLTFLAFGMALIHGIFAGTDSSQVWVRDMYLLTGAAVAIFTIYRMPSGSGESPSSDEPRPRSAQPSNQPPVPAAPAKR